MVAQRSWLVRTIREKAYFAIELFLQRIPTTTKGCASKYIGLCGQICESVIWHTHCALISEFLESFGLWSWHAQTRFSLGSIILSEEDTAGLWLISSFPVFSSSCPCLFRIKIEAHTLIFWSLKHVFREACPTINWFAYRRLERYSRGVTTVRTCDFEHSFFKRVNHLY